MNRKFIIPLFFILKLLCNIKTSFGLLIFPNISKKDCQDDTISLKKLNHMKNNYSNKEDYINLSIKILGCLWGIDEFNQMSKIQQNLTYELISESVDGKNKKNIYHENFINDWGPKGKLLTNILATTKNLKDDMETLRKSIDSNQKEKDEDEDEDKDPMEEFYTAADNLKAYAKILEINSINNIGRRYYTIENYKNVLFQYFCIPWLYRREMTFWQKKIIKNIINLIVDESKQMQFSIADLILSKALRFSSMESLHIQE